MVDAELNYRRINPACRWTMPAKWYRVSLPTRETAGDDPGAGHQLLLSRRENGRQRRARPAASLADPRTGEAAFNAVALCLRASSGLRRPVIMGTPPTWSKRSSRCWKSTKRSISTSPATITICNIWKSKAIRQRLSSATPGARWHGIRRRSDNRGPFFKAVYGFSHLELRADTFTLHTSTPTETCCMRFRRTLPGKVTNFG